MMVIRKTFTDFGKHMSVWDAKEALDRIQMYLSTPVTSGFFLLAVGQLSMSRYGTQCNWSTSGFLLRCLMPIKHGDTQQSAVSKTWCYVKSVP